MRATNTNMKNKAGLPDQIYTWRLDYADKDNATRNISPCTIPLPEIGNGQVLVEIAGCGICGTDISFFRGEVQPVSKLPLTLGHEISGIVISGDQRWIGKKVIVPTILPCNHCEFCKKGRANRCLAQKMLGYNFGPYGGFSSHVVVPADDLCEVPATAEIELSKLAVVADAVATPFQAALRADLGPCDKVIVIGATGGLGIYMTQWAKLLGASMVIGIGKNKEKLETAEAFGLDASICTSGRSSFDIRCDIMSYCKKKGVDHRGFWKIFEMSGTAEGQRLGLDLLVYTSTLVIVGYGVKDLSYNFSRLMAFDSHILGSWGCAPAHYPTILKHVLEGRIDIRPFVELRPLSSIVESIQEILAGRKSMKRIVLLPDK